MSEPYKLKEQVRAFIVDRKKVNPLLSCRQLVPLVGERFGLKLSKSSINAIIKGQLLSSRVGRRRIHPGKIKKGELPPEAPAQKSSPSASTQDKPPDSEVKVEIQPAPEKLSAGLIINHGDLEYAVNCGCFLLRAADYKTLFTNKLSQLISPLLPEVKSELIFFLLEALLYKQIFKDNKELWGFLGKEMEIEYFSHLYNRISQIDFSLIRNQLIKIGLEEDNTLNLNGLCTGRLQRLNSLVQELFFPAVYQYLDLPTMFQRFFCLSGRVERKNSLLAIRFFYPENFKWTHDIVWQEDFFNTAHKINDEKIQTPEGERIWFDTAIGVR